MTYRSFKKMMKEEYGLSNTDHIWGTVRFDAKKAGWLGTLKIKAPPKKSGFIPRKRKNNVHPDAG